EPRVAINASNTPGDADSLFKITQPGSYYLTDNITGVAGKHGVEIAASGVTLHLNGLDLLGVPGSLDGVSVTELSLKNIAVVNGSVRSWDGDGVDLRSYGAANWRAADLLAGGNTGDGIKVGSVCTVLSCSAYQNTGNGITTGNGCTVSNCLAYQNTAIGIRTNTGCTLSNCSAYVNTGSGISIDDGSTVSHCSAVFNTGNGISTLEGGCTVSICSAYSNIGNGISVNSNCTVADCTARGNTLDGIRCSPGCLIRNNVCSFNGTGGDGAGIHATGADNRIEDNNCTSADRGIDVDLAGNIIVRNTCSGNLTNWDVVAGNVCLVVQGVTGAAILGNTGGVAPGSTDPNANFTY
ncbi:MAG TPA: right-handed parallel beta-helix repeat-containing protein, partial [Phycisphaerae bacterium]|nr:right-handed parallel beta-helix repeat-containing protein [Phycisphaerae bacterium]